MTIHIGAKQGDIAETVLLPGDPYRARWVAETFLDEARLVTEVRGTLGYTGRWKDNPVTIQGSGMGMPSLSIYDPRLRRENANPNRFVRRSGGRCQVTRYRVGDDRFVDIDAKSRGIPGTELCPGCGLDVAAGSCRGR